MLFTCGRITIPRVTPRLISKLPSPTTPPTPIGLSGPHARLLLSPGRSNPRACLRSVRRYGAWAACTSTRCAPSPCRRTSARLAWWCTVRSRPIDRFSPLWTRQLHFSPRRCSASIAAEGRATAFPPPLRPHPPSPPFPLPLFFLPTLPSPSVPRAPAARRKPTK